MKPLSGVPVSFLCALSVFVRLSAVKWRNARRRKRLCRLLLLADQFVVDNPASYCKLNHNVPILRLWFDVEAELTQDFRLRRRTMHGLQKLLQRDQDHGWGHQLEILIYVYWLAHGLSYRVVSSVFNVPRSTVHRIIHKVAQSIWLNLNLAISFPQIEDLRQVGQRFVELSGTSAFNNIVGVMDSTHIRIKPPQQHRIDYLNSKGFYSVNMQAVCDSGGKFLDIFIGFPGSVHDVQIMRNSSFYRAKRYPPAGYALLGDEDYPCLDSPICLITPYVDPADGFQNCFNHYHSRAHRATQRAFGMMKTRWRSTLFRPLEVKPTFAPQVISSCAFLHNICLDHRDTVEMDEDIAEDLLDRQPLSEPLTENETSGSRTRDRLAALCEPREGLPVHTASDTSCLTFPK